MCFHSFRISRYPKSCVADKTKQFNMFIMFSSGWLVIISYLGIRKVCDCSCLKRLDMLIPEIQNGGWCCWSIVVQFGTRTKSVKELWLPQITTDSLENLYIPFLPKQTIHKQKMQILLTVVLPKRATNWRACPSEVINAPFRAFLVDFATICGPWWGKLWEGLSGLWLTETRWVKLWDPFERSRTGELLRCGARRGQTHMYRPNWIVFVLYTVQKVWAGVFSEDKKHYVTQVF